MNQVERIIRDAVVVAAYHARPEPGSPAAVAINALLNMLDRAAALDPDQARRMADNALAGILTREPARPDPQGAEWMESRLLDFLADAANPPLMDAEVIDLSAERQRRRVRHPQAA